MTFLEELKELWLNGLIPECFTVAEVKQVTDNKEADNLSNYAIDNRGSSNDNQKVLTRRINANGNYEYTFPNGT